MGTVAGAEPSRVLWKSDHLPDNHTADSFLEHLVLNATVRTRNYWQVVSDSQAVSLQVSIVLASIEVFLFLHSKWVTPTGVLAITCSVILTGQLFVRWAAGPQLGGTVLQAVRQCMLLGTGVYLLSPLYSTLTKTISDDTIIAASTWLLLAHLYMHDYHFITSVADRVTGSLSLAAAVGASLLLASRLQQPQAVFAHILFCLAAYLLFPFLCRHLQIMSQTTYTSIVLALAGITAALLNRFRWQWQAAYVCLQLGLVFVCPWLLLSISKFKAQINGPWDEAVPKLARLDPL